MHKVIFIFWFSDSRDLPGQFFAATKRKKLAFIPTEGMSVFFSHWGMDFWLEVSSVHWDIKTGVFQVDLRDHENALDSQEWDVMEAFFLEQGWKVDFALGRPKDPIDDEEKDASAPSTNGSQNE